MWPSLLFCCSVLLSPPSFHGAAVSFYGEGVHGAGSYEDTLTHLHQSGGRSVNFVVPWTVDSVRGHVIERQPNETPSDATLRRSIRQAHALGMSVLVMPILLLKRSAVGEWRGKLSPSEPDRFWQSYERFITHYAQLSESEGVALLSVGSELSALEQERGYWKRLIKRVREAYSGSLIYSANWDHFDRVSFWSELDYVGISAYFELSTDRNASAKSLERAWSKLRWMILDWLSDIGKPLVFTELGYPSLDGGAVYPWNYEQGTALDLDEQRRALWAFRKVWSRESRLRGVFFWNWWGPRDGKNSWYTIPGKPGEIEVRNYFEDRTLVP